MLGEKLHHQQNAMHRTFEGAHKRRPKLLSATIDALEAIDRLNSQIQYVKSFPPIWISAAQEISDSPRSVVSFLVIQLKIVVFSQFGHSFKVKKLISSSN